MTIDLSDTSLSASTDFNSLIQQLVEAVFPSTPVALIPVMTSNNTPSGVVTASSENVESQYSIYQYGWKAFNRVGGERYNSWNSSRNATPNWLCYEFPQSVRVTKWYIQEFKANSADKTFHLQASDDGQTWTQLDTITLSGSGTEATSEFANYIAYKYYRIYTIDVLYDGNAGLDYGVEQLQLYGH